MLTAALIPHVNGFMNWPTFDIAGAADISDHSGIFDKDEKPKAVTGVYADLLKQLNGKRQTRAAATNVLTYSLLGLYTCRSYQDTMWDEIHAVIREGKTPDIKFV